MKIYLAGPMSGIPQFNFPAFDRAAAELRSQGHEVFNPAEMDDPVVRKQALKSKDGASKDVTETWGDFLARDVKLIADGGIEAVVLLSGWNTSRGARLESFLAYNLKLDVYTLNGSTLFRQGKNALLRAWAR